MTNEASLKVAYLTSGAANMFCGSCMRDNTLAVAMRELSVDMLLLPTYTPIRTDENNVSSERVFFGGVNIFLQQKIPLFRYLPRSFDRILDNPRFIRWATKRSTSVDAKQLGALTVSMLKGKQGNQRKEVDRLCDWMVDSFRPKLINLSNALIAGCVPELRKRLSVPIVVTLQGDDIFLDELTPKYRDQAIAEIQRIDRDIDAYVAFSSYYADYMANRLGIARDKIHCVPLGIDVTDFSNLKTNETSAESKKTSIGYLARMAPEKGLHVLVDAFIKLHQTHGLSETQLLMAGWMGDHRKEYVDQQFAKLDDAGLKHAYQYFGTIDRQEKIDFLSRLDILSVPTTYHEPKGLFVLEAMACGIPVVQPNHGAFPEIIRETGGGILCASDDADDTAEKLASLLRNNEERKNIGKAARDAVLQHRTAKVMAAKTLELYQRLIPSTRK